METKIENTNSDGKVLAYDEDKLVGQLDFSYEGDVMKIDHTRAFKKGMGAWEEHLSVPSTTMPSARV